MTRVEQFARRLEARSSTVVDPWWLAPGALSLALAVTALAQLLERGCCNAPPIVGGPMLALIAVLWVLVTCGPSRPRLLCLLLVLPPTALRIAWSYDDLTPLYLLLVPAWAGYTARMRIGLVVLALSALALVPEMLVLNVAPYSGLAWWLGMVFSWLTAHLLARQRRLLLALRAAQAELTSRAIAEERHRIAREVHDVIAHALTVTMLQITGARHVLRRDPEAADAALAEAERLGRQSLADIRRTVGLLSDAPTRSVELPGEAPARGPEAPLPSLDELPALVEGLRHAGLGVDLRVHGEAGRLAAAPSLGLYRIAQEALANAAKHAPGARVEVELVVDGDVARLRVADTGAPTGARPSPAAGGSGLGISSMRERAAMLGGSLQAGPLAGGWLVECRVPVASAALVG
jgi:signal transduction histidine kinase